MSKLKIRYEMKRATLINRLNTQQKGVEDIFKVYYEALDELRYDMLGDEYRLRKQLSDFEGLTRNFVNAMETYSIYEFYTDQDGLEEQMQKLEESLNSFNTYLPKQTLLLKDLPKAKLDIKQELRERMNQYFKQVDHTFSLKNYNFVLE